MTTTTAPPTTTTTTTTAVPVSSPGDYLLLPRAELLALPTSGGAWESLLNQATGTWGTIDLTDQDNKTNVKAFAGALVYARTGDAELRAKVRDAIAVMIPTFDASGSSGLAVGRQMTAWVLAADFINLGEFDPDLDSDFRAHCSEMLSGPSIGTHSRWGVNLAVTHNDSANNWGGWAGASRIACELYLGNDAGVLAAANTTRGFLGDPSYWSNFRVETADDVISWMCEPAVPTPVNAPCVKDGINLDGFVPADISRDGTTLAWPPSSAGQGYTNEIVAGMALQAELLYRNGFTEIYGFQSDAVKRMGDVLTRIDEAGGNGWNGSAVDTHVAWLLNRRYGTSYPTVPPQLGRSFGFTDWIYAG